MIRDDGCTCEQAQLGAQILDERDPNIARAGEHGVCVVNFFALEPHYCGFIDGRAAFRICFSNRTDSVIANWIDGLCVNSSAGICACRHTVRGAPAKFPWRVTPRRQECEHTIQPTGACNAGVKVRVARQRKVGRFARHSGADIAAGVTPGHPWRKHGQSAPTLIRGHYASSFTGIWPAAHAASLSSSCRTLARNVFISSM